jgi:hypothetical protein
VNWNARASSAATGPWWTPQPSGSASRHLASYQRLYEQTLAKLPGVRGLTSTIVMKQVIEPRPLPANP